MIVATRRKISNYGDKFANVLETTLEDVAFSPNKVHISNTDATVDIDCIILCTGYDINIPFLSPECGLEVSRGRVFPLYRHCINCRFPTMAVIGLLGLVPVFSAGPEAQIQFYKAWLDRRFSLPPLREMIESAEWDDQDRLGAFPDQAHALGPKAFAYLRQLAQEAGLPEPEPILEKMWLRHLQNMPYNFRDFRFEKIDAENFIHEPLDDSSLKNGKDVLLTLE